MHGVRTISRLSKNAILSLFETHTRRIEPVADLSAFDHKAWVGIEWRRRHLIVRGHSTKGLMTIAFDGRAGLNVNDCFDIKLRRPDRTSGATVSLQAHQRRVHFPAPGPVKILLAALGATPKVILDLFRSSRDIITFLKTNDPATALRLRKRFGITPPNDTGCTLPHDLVSDTHRPPVPTDKATIVVPVYNAYDDVASLLPRLRGAQYPILLVDDGSDDARIAPLLSEFTDQMPTAKVISHCINQGFVAAANTGFDHSNGHVILLNSDTILPSGDWTTRLLEPMVNDPTVASVTPFSNNAEIISVPSARTVSQINPILVDKIDDAAKRFAPRHSTCELPTGIGFCMALNQDFLARIGPFDPAFGRGYGEEVDWCQRARLAGGRNLALSSVFVGHKGGASFGAQKQDRIKAAARIINTRYPTYDSDVENWVADAPAQAQILALSIVWLAALAKQPTPVFFGHSMGGGAEAALQDEITIALKDHPGVVLLRVGGPTLWRLEVIGQEFHLRGDASNEASILALLKPLDHLRLVYSCGVGGRHPLDAPNLLSHIFDARCTLEICIHDFFPVSPSWNLLDASGRFDGVPDVSTTDTAHSLPALHGHAPVSHAEWRARWSKLFSLAQRVIVFSESSDQLIKIAYPHAAPKTVIRPHKLANLPDPVPRQGTVVGILGSLNEAKGAGVVQRLANTDFSARKFVVLGEIDGKYSLKKPSVVHGRYAQRDINALAQKYDIGVWLLPSICPETFSFATHEALATGLPVLAFAHGAQGDTVRDAGNGRPIKSDPLDTQTIAAEIEDAFANANRDVETISL